MSKTLRITVPLILLAAMLLSACGAKETTPTVNPDQIYTAAAMTVVAQFTESAALNPTATATVEPTATQIPPTATILIPTINVNSTQTTPITATNAVVMATSSVLTAAQTTDPVYEITYQYPPDQTELSPNVNFTSIWTVKNNGTETWTTDYAIVFFAGDRLGAERFYKFAKEVAPGGSINLRIDMTTPSTKGEYNSWWKLQDANGKNFGDVDVTITIPG